VIPMTMPFGKHKGEPVEDLPSDYIEWLLAECELRPALQKELENQLVGRQGGGIVRGKTE
jgi:exodeoxyribonuclease X